VCISVCKPLSCKVLTVLHIYSHYGYRFQHYDVNRGGVIKTKRVKLSKMSSEVNMEVFALSYPYARKKKTSLCNIMPLYVTINVGCYCLVLFFYVQRHMGHGHNTAVVSGTLDILLSGIFSVP